MAKKKGICKNVDGCSLAQEKIVQEAESTQFVCEECGKPLVDVVSKNKGKKSRGAGSKKGPVIGIVAGILVLGGAVFGVVKSGIFKEKTPEETQLSWSAAEVSHVLGDIPQLPVLTAVPEGLEIVYTSSDEAVASVSADGQVKPLSAGEAMITASFAGSKEQAPATSSYILTVKEKPKVLPTEDGKYSLGWGIYEGPKKNGRPHGIQGEVKVKKYHTIDLKSGADAKQVSPGDRIVNCKFVDGKLVYGVIKYRDGRQEAINIGI